MEYKSASPSVRKQQSSPRAPTVVDLPAAARQCRRSTSGSAVIGKRQLVDRRLGPQIAAGDLQGHAVGRVRPDRGTHTCRQAASIRHGLTVIHCGSPGPTPMPYKRSRRHASIDLRMKRTEGRATRLRRRPVPRA